MINTLLGIKKGMVSSYDARGRRVGATIVELGPNFVTQIKSAESTDGYNSIQLGFGSRKYVKKPQLGLFKKANIDQNLRWLREVRIKPTRATNIQKDTATQASLEDVEVGKEIKVEDIFRVGDVVKVTGTSKGKGFQGGVRRHGFHGGPKTHGQSDRHRAPGSIGSGTTPGRVFKGKRMAGHMGSETVSYTGLEVLAVDKTNNLVTIKGGVPGFSGGLVVVEKLGRIKGYTPPPEEKPEEEESESREETTEGLKEEAQEQVVEQSEQQVEEGEQENAS